jgi:hypothetical protein
MDSAVRFQTTLFVSERLLARCDESLDASRDAKSFALCTRSSFFDLCNRLVI